MRKAKNNTAEVSLLSISKDLKALKQKVENIATLVGLNTLVEFDSSEIIDKAVTKAYVEVSGEPGKERVYYRRNGKRVLAKINKEATEHLGYVVAIVPRDADDYRTYLPIHGKGSAPGGSVIIEKKGSSLIRVINGSAQFRVNGRWKKSRSPKVNPAVLDLDGRGIREGKKIGKIVAEKGQ